MAKVSRGQLVIVRAEAVVWNDGSLGCPEPGMEHAQTLVNGFRVVINAARQTYDFRAGPGGSFSLCPAGRSHPPLQSECPLSRRLERRWGKRDHAPVNYVMGLSGLHAGIKPSYTDMNIMALIQVTTRCAPAISSND